MAEKSLDRWYKELLFYVERTEKAEKNEWNLRGKKTQKKKHVVVFEEEKFLAADLFQLEIVKNVSTEDSSVKYSINNVFYQEI